MFREARSPAMPKDYEEHLHWGTPQLVIAFAGGPQNVYQFGRSLAYLQIDHILIRDSIQHYNHLGVIGIGSREQVIKYLVDISVNHQKLITTGVSSGAYPALLYGQLVPADEVIVFSALTGRQADDFAEEDKWQVYDPNNTDVDLRQFFLAPKNALSFIRGPLPRIKSFISDGEGTKLDRYMSERIGITDITVIPGYAHADLARGMRDMGMFKELFA